MSVTYTRLLWEEFGLPAGYTTGPVVPVDELWVVRSIVLYLPAYAPSQFVGGALVVDGNNIPLGGIGSADARSHRVHLVDDLRQVVNPTDSLNFLSSSALWQLRVSGFVFSAP